MSETLKVLPFRDASSALEYVCKYFTPQKIDKGVQFVGVVRGVDTSKTPEIFQIEICAFERSFFRKTNKRKLVAAIQHPECDEKIYKGDLVSWGFHEKVNTIDTGFILYKLSLDLDMSSGSFSIYEMPDNKEDLSDADQEEIINMASAIRNARNHAEADIEFKYGKILSESDIYEEDGCIFISYAGRYGTQIIGWDSKKSQWVMEVDKVKVLGFFPSSPRRIKELIFNSNGDINFTRKWSLVNRLLFGISSGWSKTLKFDSTIGNVAIEIESKDWNQIVIGLPFEKRLRGRVKSEDGNHLDEFTVRVNFDGVNTSEESRDYGMVSITWHDPTDSWVNVEALTGTLRDIQGYYSDPVKSGEIVRKVQSSNKNYYLEKHKNGLFYLGYDNGSDLRIWEFMIPSNISEESLFDSFNFMTLDLNDRYKFYSWLESQGVTLYEYSWY